MNYIKEREREREREREIIISIITNYKYNNAFKN